MRTLTVQEMEQAAGGAAVPVLGVILAFAGLVVRHKVLSTAIGVAGLIHAGHSLVQSQQENSCPIE